MPLIVDKITARFKRHIAPFTRYIGQYGENSYPENTRLLCVENHHVFGGYYDVSPFSADGRYVLALAAEQDFQSPHHTHTTADIGYFDLYETIPTFRKVAETTAWNWQQGTRLQWFGASNDHVIYNRFNGERFHAVICDVQTKQAIKSLSHPVYSLHPSGREMLSLSFSRLHSFRRGYGYHQLTTEANALAPQDDGLWRINFGTETPELILSLDKIAQFNPTPDMADAFHYLNHAQWSPDGTYITFFHLWTKTGQKSKNVRMLIMATDGTLRSLDNTLRPSHPTWVDNHHILVTGHKKENDKMYHLYQISGGGVSYVESLDMPLEDGHPGFINSNQFITDTYPDIFGYQKLLLCDVDGGQQELSQFYLPSQFAGELRCDTHPRLSQQKNMVAIDVVLHHKRCMAIIPLTLKA